MIALIFYFAINSFFAGYIIGSRFELYPSKKLVIFTAFIALLGIPFFIVEFVVALFLAVFGLLEERFQIMFWLKFWFTSKYHNFNKDILHKMYSRMLWIEKDIPNRTNFNKGSGKAFIRAVRAIASRNNYVHPYQEKP